MRITRKLKSPLAISSAVFVAVAICATGTSVANATNNSHHGHNGHGDWFTTWAQSQQALANTTLTNQSVRMITHLSQGGDSLRIRIQNQFGTGPITIDSVAVGLSDNTVRVIPGTSRNVTFPGNHDGSVTVAAGSDAWSNPVKIHTRPQDDIAVSMYVAGSVTPGQHNGARRDNYVTPAGSGNHVSESSGASYTEVVTSTYFVSAVDVHNPRLLGTIVPYGSSVVDGTGSTNCGPGCTITGNNQRWTDDLARRIVNELPANQQFTVANEGIGGTTSSAECVDEPDRDKGLEANPRLDRDVLALHGVTAVLYYYGTNDIQDHCTADQILSSYQEAFKRLHQAGIKVYVTPITPRPIYDDQMNVYRHAVNRVVSQYSNCSNMCDGIFDFDRVIQDDLNPNAINLAYDNGDGIHANIDGQQHEADTIGLQLLVASAR
ncbi:MAG TPA: GDSL-type esterase/lipase family protein [Mycobacteriales bacterium]|nr:GDSL-type esterase/lipase family protein [Mycobacteriales bacterium]